MIAIFVILIFVVYLCFFYPLEPRSKPVEEKSPHYKEQMKKLWQIAQTSMKERKPFRAEKALLTILKFDEKNAAAYNRLGILYAKEQKYDEAVECFEIAQSLDNNPASIHNAGLIYLETEAYEKAAIAFEQAIELEGDVATRHIALAKANEKLGRYKKAIQSLENAYDLDPKVSTLRQMLALYEDLDDIEGTTALAARIEAQIAKDNAAREARTPQKHRRATRESHVTRQMPTPRTNPNTMRAANSINSKVAASRNTTTTPATPATAAPRRKILRKRI